MSNYTNEELKKIIVFNILVLLTGIILNAII
jgi:hypothetical protein